MRIMLKLQACFLLILQSPKNFWYISYSLYLDCALYSCTVVAHAMLAFGKEINNIGDL